MFVIFVCSMHVMCACSENENKRFADGRACDCLVNWPTRDHRQLWYWNLASRDMHMRCVPRWTRSIVSTHVIACYSISLGTLLWRWSLRPDQFVARAARLHTNFTATARDWQHNQRMCQRRFGTVWKTCFIQFLMFLHALYSYIPASNEIYNA